MRSVSVARFRQLVLTLLILFGSLTGSSAQATPISFVSSEVDLLATADIFRIEPPAESDSDAAASKASDVTVFSDSVSATATVTGGSAVGVADLDMVFAGSTLFAEGNAGASFFEPGEVGGDGFGRSYLEITFSADRQVGYSIDGSLVADAPFGGMPFASVILRDEFGGIVFDQTIDGSPNAFLDFTETGTLAAGTYTFSFEATALAPDGALPASFLVSGTIPEPTTATLLGLGLMGIASRRRRAAVARPWTGPLPESCWGVRSWRRASLPTRPVGAQP